MFWHADNFLRGDSPRENEALTDRIEEDRAGMMAARYLLDEALDSDEFMQMLELRRMVALNLGEDRV